MIYEELVLKRDGHSQVFDKYKILTSIMKAGGSSDLADIIANDVYILYKGFENATVEDISDLIEMQLMKRDPSVAKTYILYRSSRAQVRQVRLDPDPKAIGGYTNISKYSRYRVDLERRETWEESSDRRMDMDIRKYPQLEDVIRQVYRDYVRTQRVLPSMRSMQFAGASAEQNAFRMYNCFSRDTTFITEDGVRSFKDFESNSECYVLSHLGKYQKAKVICYGKQQLYEVTLQRRKSIIKIKTTKNHRWLLINNKETTDLKYGDKVICAPNIKGKEFNWELASIEEKIHWCEGYHFGDGTINYSNNKGYRQVRLCGKDNKYLNRFIELGFTYSNPPSYNGDPIVYMGIGTKEPPENPDLAFISGYLDADGSHDKKGRINSIQATGSTVIKWIREKFPIFGLYITNEYIPNMTTNFGNRTQETIKFSLMSFSSQEVYNNWKVINIVKKEIEDVWCLEVEEDHSFCFPSGIATGNCAYTLIDRPRVFSEIFFLLLSGCGVGYSVQNCHINKLPKINKVNRKNIYYYQIPDSIEGWSLALEILIDSYINSPNNYVEFDYSLIRAEGIPLKTSGGKAPGHIPLKRMLEQIRNILDKTDKLKPIEAHDICCYVAQAVLAGGIRRSSLIALFSPEDLEMTMAKTGEWYKVNKQREMANNSAVFIRGDNFRKNTFYELFKQMKEFGEPGFAFLAHQDYGLNPCGEIGLNPVSVEGETGFALCNLSTINASKVKSVEDFIACAEVASFIGTLQAGYTHFPYVTKVTKNIVEREALLGVSIGGILDNPITSNPENQRYAALAAVENNKKWAKIIGINPAARVTTVKPDGTCSLLMGTGSGIHPHHARRYIRRVTANPNETPFQYFQSINPHMCVLKPNGDWVIEFPVKARDDAVIKSDLTAIQFMDKVYSTYLNWIVPGTADIMSSPGLTHNVSTTVSVKPNEWDSVRDYAWLNRHKTAAMSFLPDTGDKIYQYAPREEIITASDEARWNELIDKYVPVDWTKMLENEDETDLKGVGACEGPKCEIN